MEREDLTLHDGLDAYEGKNNGVLEDTKEACSYRNQVDELHTKNRKLHCEMND